MANIDIYNNNLMIGRLKKENIKHLYSYSLDANSALSLTMPVRLESYSYDGLHPFFQMNIPEGVLRKAIEKATAKEFGSDDLTVLALLGNNQIGSVRYTLEDKNLPDEVICPIDAYIVKSWGKEYPELACNEFICLTMAKEAGLEVSPFYLSDNGKLLITKHFDLDNNSNPLGFENFCVLQGKSTKQKYDASLESCANTIRLYVSTKQQQKALYDFFKLTLVNIYLRNR